MDGAPRTPGVGVAWCRALTPFEVGAPDLSRVERVAALEDLEARIPERWRPLIGEARQSVRNGHSLPASLEHQFAVFTTYAEARCGTNLPHPPETP